jgi:hypothetical protein
MVEQFKTFALNRVEIVGKYAEALKVHDAAILEQKAILALPKPVLSLADVDGKDGLQKFTARLQDYVKKQADAKAGLANELTKREESVTNYTDVLKQLYEVSRPLRLAVCKEWSQMVNEGIAKNHLVMWVRPTADSDYKIVTFAGGIVRLNNISVRLSADMEELGYDYMAYVDSPRCLRALPVMSSLPRDVELAILSAMHGPNSRMWVS